VGVSVGVFDPPADSVEVEVGVAVEVAVAPDDVLSVDVAVGVAVAPDDVLSVDVAVGVEVAPDDVLSVDVAVGVEVEVPLLSGVTGVLVVSPVEVAVANWPDVAVDEGVTIVNPLIAGR